MKQTILEHLQDLSIRLVSEIKTLVSSYPSLDRQHPILSTCEGQAGEIEARSNVLSSLNEIETLICGPKEFLENLAIQ
ncbi:hypothetical protein E4U54_004837, partial [Claviceps lovelessii]